MTFVVEDHETILRRVFCPHHVELDGRIKSAAFSPSSDSYCLSVNRQQIVSFKQVCNIGYREQNKSNLDPIKQSKQFMGCVQASAAEVHAEKISNVAVMLVIATPRPELKSHADIQLPSKSKGLRKKLRDVFSDLISPS
jgi:hypothetical protein